MTSLSTMRAPSEHFLSETADNRPQVILQTVYLLAAPRCQVVWIFHHYPSSAMNSLGTVRSPSAHSSKRRRISRAIPREQCISGILRGHDPYSWVGPGSVRNLTGRVGLGRLGSGNKVFDIITGRGLVTVTRPDPTRPALTGQEPARPGPTR